MVPCGFTTIIFSPDLLSPDSWLHGPMRFSNNNLLAWVAWPGFLNGFPVIIFSPGLLGPDSWLHGPLRFSYGNLLAWVTWPGFLAPWSYAAFL